jgi:putative phosphoribosyl transferase
MSAWSSVVRRDAGRVFQDRCEAGRVLAQELTSYRGQPDLLVLGLARGGVPIGWEVAAALEAPLDVFLVRKLGVPQWPELAMGALASGGGIVINEHLVNRLGIGSDELDAAIEREKAELTRREQAYRGGRPAPEVTDRTVILVDDGIATGASMLAAIRAVRAARRLVVAVPVGPASVCRELAQEADEVVCASTPTDFSAVGQAFADFHQVTDGEVRRLLATPTVSASD